MIIPNRTLFYDELMPINTKIVGYARSPMSKEKLHQHIGKHIKLEDEEDKQLFEEFLKQNHYVQGSYDMDEDFVRLSNYLEQLEQSDIANRLIYLALPPNIFEISTKLIHRHCWKTKYCSC